MAANIRNKISNILQDTERAPDVERLNKLERLFEEELHSLSRTHALSIMDMTYIRSRSIEVYNQAAMTSFSVEGKDHRFEPEHLRTYAYIRATVDFLRKEGLTKLDLKVKK